MSRAADFGRAAVKKAHIPQRKGLLVIAVFRLIKATLLLAAGFFVLHMRHTDIEQMVLRWAGHLRVDPESHFFHRVVEKLGILTDKHLVQLSLISFFYSALMFTEGIGLYMEKHWAEWLTVIATASFIPLEIYEIVRHTTWMKIAVLIINIAIVGYVVWVIRSDRKG